MASLVICRICRMPIVGPGLCACTDETRRAYREENRRKPIGPRPLSAPAACLLAGFVFGVLVGVFGYGWIRLAW